MIEVGEYVRTNNGLLGRVNKIELKGSGIRYAGEFITDTIIQFNDGKVYERRVRNKDIVKHSKNIIDLLQEEDYVNGYKVVTIDTDAPNNCKECIELDRNNAYEYQWISKNEIETILTKEQYMKNCYKIPEKSSDIN